nr:putative amidase [Quercus suber]
MSATLTNIDLLSLSASEAARLLDAGELSSVTLLDAYLCHIEDHNHNGLHLNALIAVIPRPQLMAAAAELDAERAAGHIRSPFHGVPIIIKDTFATHPDTGLPSTAGGPCFRTAKPKHTAPVIQELIDRGLILLGKANMTEFCGLKMRGLTPGYSPMGGQTQSPYIFGGLDPKDKAVIGHSSAAGSSSGSASGVEVSGSVITPASRAGLYALKCGPGMVDMEGVFVYTDVFDSVGGMAKSARDLRWLSDVLMDKEDDGSEVPEHIKGLGERLSISNDQDQVTGRTCDRRHCPSCTMEYVQNRRRRQLHLSHRKYDRNSLRRHLTNSYPDLPSTVYQFKNLYLSEWLKGFATSEVHSLEDIIKYNEDHADVCLPPNTDVLSEYPSQHEFTDLLSNETTLEECDAMVKDMRNKAHEALDPVLKDHDMVVSFADSALCIYASAAGQSLMSTLRCGTNC